MHIFQYILSSFNKACIKYLDKIFIRALVLRTDIMDNNETNIIDNYNDFEYPSKRIIEKESKKSKIQITSLIITLIIIFLLISTLFLSWYSIGMGISAFFFFPISMDADMNFHLTELALDASTNMNDANMTKDISYSDFEEEAIKQGKTSAIDMINLIRNTTIFVIILLIFSIFAFIGLLCSIIGFGNKYTMKKIGLVFGILTFILGIFTAGYFMYEWDSNIIKDGLPDLDSDDTDSSSSETINLLDTEELDNYMKDIGFWDSISISGGFPETNDSDTGIISNDEDSDLDLYTFNFTFTPGLSWYIIILVSVLSLLLTILLFNKKLKMMLILLLICSVALFGFIYYLSLNANAEEKSSNIMDMDFWDFDSDPAEVSKFLGTWELDIKNTTGYKEDENLTKETWTFWQNETHDMFETKYTQEYGSASMSCSFSAKDNRLNICYNTYDYVFSENDMKLTVTRENEKLILNKI